MKKIALVRGRFLTKYDMEPFEALSEKYKITAFGSKKTFSDKLDFPVVKLGSPVDVPNFPYKMPILNRIFIDAQYLFGLEEKLIGFDIAHSAETYFGYTQQVLNAKKKGYVKKVVLSVLENIPFNNEGIWARKSFKNRAIKEADHFIALSSGARDALIEEGANPDKISHIGFGINTNKFYPVKIKKKANLNILFAGRMETYKGIFDVLEVFQEIVKVFPNIELTVVGKGSQEASFRRKVKQLGFEDKVNHKIVDYNSIAEEYQKADIFFAPSKKDKYWIEQFGMVFLEAMASGLPILATKSGAIPEVVGSTAILVEEGNVAQMKKHLALLLGDSNIRLKMGETARKRAVKYFDIKVIARKIDSVYEGLI